MDHRDTEAQRLTEKNEREDRPFASLLRAFLRLRGEASFFPLAPGTGERVGVRGCARKNSP
jgi:hypothetical protein